MLALNSEDIHAMSILKAFQQRFQAVHDVCQNVLLVLSKYLFIHSSLTDILIKKRSVR